LQRSSWPCRGVDPALFRYRRGDDLNDVGPGLGQVGATESFEIVNPLAHFVLTACMLLGRLEIFTVLALLSPAFWKR
jgi:hypothetical protein